MMQSDYSQYLLEFNWMLFIASPELLIRHKMKTLNR
jgi:hypothetical protein